jgi:hypothetical protein
MLADILVCIALYYLFFILEENQAAVVAPESPLIESTGSPDDWEPDSEGGITLPCSTPSPPLGLSRPSTPETVIPLVLPRDQVRQLQQDYQDLIDSQEQNWWTPAPGSYEKNLPGLIRHPFPTIVKGPRYARRYIPAR